MHRLILSLLVTFLLGACASSRTSYENEPFTSASTQPLIRLVVQNRNFSDARLYAVRRGTRRSLGTVGGKTDQEYTLDWNMSDPLRIEIHLLAGPTCTTREIRADPGDVFELQIEPVFSQSRACR